MDFSEVVRSAIEAIKINKLRSALTALGVIIGVAAIILLISISGAAVTSVKMSGAKHKFSTIPGLKENLRSWGQTQSSFCQENSGLVRKAARHGQSINLPSK